MSELKPCPFCGSTDIDPEGVSSFKEGEMHDENGKLRNWKDDALPERIEHRPACSNCSATTDGDWNTRAALSQPSVSVDDLGDCIYQAMHAKPFCSELDIAQAILAKYPMLGTTDAELTRLRRQVEVLRNGLNWYAQTENAAGCDGNSNVCGVNGHEVAINALAAADLVAKQNTGCLTEMSSNSGDHWNAVSQHIGDRLKRAALANQIREEMKIFIKQNQTPRGGYTRAFVESIGVEWPLTHGWKERWIQKQVEAKLNA